MNPLRSRRPLLAVPLAAVLLTALVATAVAATFTGTTAQDRPVTVTTGNAGVPKSIAVRWRARCKSDQIFATNTAYKTLDEAGRFGFTAARTYDGNPYGAYTFRITFRVGGTRVSRERWTGSFYGFARVFKNGRFHTTCATGRVGWDTLRSADVAKR